jgi:hypothetical protein
MTASPFCADMTDRFSASTQPVINLKGFVASITIFDFGQLVADLIRQALEIFFRLFKLGNFFRLLLAAHGAYECRTARQRFYCWYLITPSMWKSILHNECGIVADKKKWMEINMKILNYLFWDSRRMTSQWWI